MAVTLNASTSSGFIATSDTSGSLELQANGTTKATVGSTGLSIGQYNPAASLITSGTAVASTSGTSIDFTGIPSWVRRITVMFNQVSTNGSSILLARLGTSGGIVTTGYDSTSSASTTAGTFNSSTAGFILTYPSGSASNILVGMVVLCNLTGNTWVESGNLSSSVSQLVNSGSSGVVTLSGVATTVRITTVNGTDTFDAGSINILYE